MANKKISELEEALVLLPNAFIPIIQGNPLDDYKISPDNLIAGSVVISDLVSDTATNTQSIVDINTEIDNIYTKTETNTLLDNKSDITHLHTGIYEPIKGSNENYVTDDQIISINTIGNKVDKVTGKELYSDTQADVRASLRFTDVEKTKLAGIESNKFVGQFISESSLFLITGTEGQYAYVDLGVGQDVTTYNWDSNDNKWIQQQGTSTSETPATIKLKYESNPDTNAFTDLLETKVNSVESGSQVNIIETISKNGVNLSVSGKTVNITVPTTTNDIPASTDKNYVTDADLLKLADIKNRTRDSIAIGENAQIGLSANASVAFGENAIANGDSTVSIGSYAVTTAKDAIAVGSGAEANAINAFAFGSDAVNNEANTMQFGGPEKPQTKFKIQTDATTVREVLSELDDKVDLTSEQNISGLKVFNESYNSECRVLHIPVVSNPIPATYTVTLSPTSAVLFSLPQGEGTLQLYEVPAATLSVIDKGTSREGKQDSVYVDYNGGSPIYAITDEDNVINSSDKVYCGTLYGSGGNMFFLPDLTRYRWSSTKYMSPISSTSNDDARSGGSLVLGLGAGNPLTKGSNTILGDGAASSLTGGIRNVIIGRNAGADGRTIMESTVLVGREANVQADSTYNAVAVGDNSKVVGDAISLGANAVNNESNTIKIGSAQQPITKLKVQTSTAVERDLISDIDGKSNLSGGNTFTGNQVFNSTSGTAFKINNTGTGHTFLAEDDTTPDASPFCINNIGRVGIGTTTPESNLHIVTLSPTNTATIRLSPYTQNSGYQTIITSMASTYGGLLNIDTTNNVYGTGTQTFSFGGTSRLSIGQNNTLSIGNSSLNSLFKVAQDSSIAGGSVSNLANSATITGFLTLFTNAFKPGDTITFGGITATIASIESDTSMTATAPIVAAHTGLGYTLVGGNRFIIKGNGNIGVGIDVPLAKFHINNTTAGNSLLIEDETSPDSTPTVIDNKGWLGCGLSTPLAQIHILGTQSAGSPDGTSRFTFESFNNVGTGEYCSAFLTKYARGTSSAPRRTKSGDPIFVDGHRGSYAADDSTNSVETGGVSRIVHYATQDFTATGRGTSIELQATPLNSTTRITALKVAGEKITVTPPTEFNENVTFVGNGTFWEDLNMNPTNLTGGGTSPSRITFGSTNIGIASFNPTSIDEVEESVELPHRWKLGSAISMHLHQYPTSTDTGTVRYGLEYFFTSENVAVTTSTTIYIEVPQSGTAWAKKSSAFADITPPSELGAQFHFRFFRDATHVNDTYTGSIAVSTIGIHFESDSLGSNGILTK